MAKKAKSGKGEPLPERYRVTDGERFQLAACEPSDTGAIAGKPQAQDLLAAGIARLAELQEKLYAQDRWGALLIFQAMDGAGKDSTIKHVMSGINPQGCQVFSFKAPSPEELDHDYLWRTSRCLPERGRIGIFNRSYYEEVLVVRVHPEILANQRLPGRNGGRELWQHRYADIRAFEEYLARQGYVILKFFLHVSREEQKKRFLERIEVPEKNWKFSAADVEERANWDRYMEAYETMVRRTAAPHAPWYVVPADHKWFTRLVVAEAVCEALERLGLAFPKVDAARRKELAAARRTLLAEE